MICQFLAFYDIYIPEAFIRLLVKRYKRQGQVILLKNKRGIISSNVPNY